MEASDAVDAQIREKIAWLETFYDKIQSCRVVIEAPHRHHRQGTIYQVRIDLKVPGGEIVVNREPGFDGAHEDVYVSIRDAFDAARRRLEDYARRERGATKVHDPTPLARVTRLDQHAGYGYLETEDGREVYFHRNSVLNDRFDDLEVGSEVRFAEEQGRRGTQASTVRMVAKAHAP